MKIGELARVTNTKAETIRYYERIGLLRQPGRTGGNYREYVGDDEDCLRFIRNARGLGFDITDVRSLLGLAEDAGGGRSKVEHIATGHLEAVDQKIAQLRKLRVELDRILASCRSGEISGLDILNSLGTSAQD